MQTDILASKHLGKKSRVSEEYDKSLLVAVLRKENRDIYSINSENLPFSGFDVWHAYEFSCLTEKGIPVTRVIKLKYGCESPFIVESKSLKLYLNSFNMTKYGKTTDECLCICKNIIEKDLSELLKTEVNVEFLNDNSECRYIFNEYTNLTDKIDENELEIVDFSENPKLLEVELSDFREYKIKFTSLRSNCRVTHQPDFGDVFIYYKSAKHIKESSLLKYLVSFRKEYHFHEECCEMIYKRLYDLLEVTDELAVCAMYTRRGGIDINPIRYSKNIGMDKFYDLLNLSTLAKGGIKQ